MAKYSLDNVEIQGFRGLKVLRLDDLGLINILVGENNCGKTSVLEALSILCNADDPNEWIRMAGRRDFGWLDETRLITIRFAFFKSQSDVLSDRMDKLSCQMKCRGTLPIRSLRVELNDIRRVYDKNNPTSFFEQSEQLDPDSQSNDIVKGIEILHHIEIMNRSDQGVESEIMKYTTPIRIWDWGFIDLLSNNTHFSNKSVSITPFSHHIHSVQMNFMSRNAFAETGLRTKDLLKVFDPGVIDIQLAAFLTDRATLYIKHEVLGIAPITVFGDGMRRAALIANALIQLKSGGVLLIDEVEAGIHVNALKKVFTWLVNAARELNVQVFVTTHSLEALDAILASTSDHLDDTVAYHLTPSANETRVKRFSGELLNRIRGENGLDVR